MASSARRREAAGALLAGGPVLPRLREFLNDVLRAALIAPGRGCMLGNTAAEVLPGDDAAGRVVRGAFRQLETTIEQALKLAQQAGETREDIDPNAHAHLLLLALMQGLHVVARAEDNPPLLQTLSTPPP